MKYKKQIIILILYLSMGFFLPYIINSIYGGQAVNLSLFGLILWPLVYFLVVGFTGEILILSILLFYIILFIIITLIIHKKLKNK